MAKNAQSATAEKKELKFEEALSTLEGIVRSLEDGEKPLEEATKAFEEGMLLAGQCQKALDHAERRIEKIVLDAEGSLTTEPLA